MTEGQRHMSMGEQPVKERPAFSVPSPSAILADRIAAKNAALDAVLADFGPKMREHPLYLQVKEARAL